MSGGVGPLGDIHIPEEEEAAAEREPLNSSTKKTQDSNLQHKHRFFTFQQLNALAIVVVFSASGMVAMEDFAFALFSFFYIFFMSRIAFPPQNSSHPPPPFGKKNRILAIYNLIGILIGLFLPIAYIFEGIHEGDKEGIKAAAPHVFLLASQIFMEGVVSSRRFSLPMRAFVLVYFNTKRILTIAEWVRIEISKVDEEYGSVRRLHVGRGLAIVNIVFWFFNLFGFFLPFYLPRTMKSYYGYKVKD
ncbi:hypothetical protein CKAN_02087700 [Cinnamomum micranthum f. kanehirae]|uniref:DUF7733 domain-containing protein n=1 Tax=Cinnamomum micranthum f. kanehirae TaxID=337451 RepID=A0A443PLR4_9MAGN|nr:hypothetical protein CKAN_02087700 [Cinnamomum micranthum f. kanehirae]